MIRYALIIFFLFFGSYSYAGGLSAWYDEKTPHENTLDCSGGADVDFHFTNNAYEQLGVRNSVDCCASFREFVFCGDYLLAKGIVNGKDSVYYIINEVCPEILKFDKQQEYITTLQKLDIKEPWSWSWNGADYGMGWGMFLIFIPIIVFPICCIVVIWLLAKVIIASYFYFSNKNKRN